MDNFIKAFDGYGLALNLMFRNKVTHKTVLGGLLTIIQFMFVGVYSYIKLSAFVTLSDPYTNKNELFFDVSEMEAVSARDIRFEFAYEMKFVNFTTGVPVFSDIPDFIDESYFKVVAMRIETDVYNNSY
jgi:hypothetical protein